MSVSKSKLIALLCPPLPPEKAKMLRRVSPFLSMVVLIAVLFMNTAVLVAATSNIVGYVKDAQTGDALPGANVLLVGTSLGASTDINGKYTVQNVPPGSYTIRATYIGYKPLEVTIRVKENVNLEQDFKLEAVGVQGQAVVVTAQASGQNSAINQQISSNRITNVVSAARIQELPDANAAESVGRLPGISLLRSGGEADQVVIRGLAPQYNEIEINGVQMASSNPNNRSADLSMISSDMLEGIQVTKTVTPDMDANVIGGVVNFELREAKVEQPGVPRLNFLAQGAYNGLPDAYNKFNNYKYVGTAEDRFFGSRLGVLAQASLERRNLSDNELGAAYSPSGNSLIDYLTRSINIDDIGRDRQRGNAVVTLDYKLPQGKIYLSNFLSSSVTQSEDREQFYNVNSGTNTQSFVSNYTKSTLNAITNMLVYEQQASIFHMKVTLSHSYSETKDPNDWSVSFINSSAGLGQFGFAANLNPQNVVKAANNDISNTLLHTVSTNYSFTRERDLAAAVDFDVHVNFSDMIASIIKFGGKFQHQTRSYDLNVIDGEPFGYASGGAIIGQLTPVFPWFKTKPGDNLNVLMTPFLDPNFSYGTFLGGAYSMIYPLNYSHLQSMVDYMIAHQLPRNITFNYDIGGSTANDYSGKEDISAAYGMATVNVGPSLTIISGVRYQQLKTVYIAAQGLMGPTSYAAYDNQLDTVTAYHPYWLPDVLLRFKPLDWFDIRLAYTNTISYPSYSALAPIIIVAQSAGTLKWNGFKLDPIRSTNYDAYFSLYGNTIGLFTAGAFLKQITNLIYQYTFTPATPALLEQYYPAWVTNRVPLSGISVTEYVNNPYRVNNYGMELDWQTHFWYLPGPLTGLVMNVNYTHIFSKAQYPFQYVNTKVRPTKYIDSTYYAPLLYQPDDIVNVTIGYDYEGFSIRVSSIYSAKIFTGPTQWPQLRAYTAAYNRWDIAVKQDLPLRGLQLFGSWNNLNGANDVSVIAAPTGVPTQEQSYDYVIELGLRYQL